MSGVMNKAAQLRFIRPRSLSQKVKYKGKFATVPGWVNNKVVKNEDELYKTWKTDIDKGNWPIYDSGPAGGKRAGEIHQIMDDEEQQARSAMKPRQAERSMLMKERLK
jgi:hypothetical protein